MNPMRRSHPMLALLLATILAAGPAFAGPPPWAGGGKGGGDERHERGARKGGGDRQERGARKGGGDRQERTARKAERVQPGDHFSGRNRDAVRSYYASAGKGGKGCPPGLAKKNNGCMPPGQAKKQWEIGERLPSTVVFHPVPQQLIVHLPPVPTGHRYVQVAGDILLIAVGTKMVVDGIDGLLR